jgi:hypothetical protein
MKINLTYNINLYIQTKKAFGLHEVPLQIEEKNYNVLKQETELFDFLTDELFLHDISTVVDDPRFFVFEVFLFIYFFFFGLLFFRFYKYTM